MTFICYNCHQSRIITGWNLTHQTVVCPTCGRHGHVGEMAERAYGSRVGSEVKKILEGVGRLGRGREPLGEIIDAAARRISVILSVAERLRSLEAQGDVVAQLLAQRRSHLRPVRPVMSQVSS